MGSRRSAAVSRSACSTALSDSCPRLGIWPFQNPAYRPAHRQSWILSRVWTAWPNRGPRGNETWQSQGVALLKVRMASLDGKVPVGRRQ
jgi:hypothetical protein